MALPSLLLTRPVASAQEFLAALDPDAIARVTPVIAPLMEIEPLDGACSPDRAKAAIFTSVNGVLFAEDGQGRIAYCVGARTTQRAAERGWDARQAGVHAAELIQTVRQDRPEGPVIHFGGVHTVGNIAQSLCADGIDTVHIALYRQQLLALDRRARNVLDAPVIVPVFSQRTAMQLVNEATGALGRAHILALSDSVAEPFLTEKTASCSILPSPEVRYMRNAVENLCWNLSLS